MFDGKKKLEISTIMGSVLSNTPAVGASIASGNETEFYFNNYYGKTHSSTNQSVSENTLFDIQSITKIVATASLLENFIESEKISLTDSVSKFVPEFKTDKNIEVRIIDLLLHQSGISDEDFTEIYHSADQLWEKMLNPTLRSTPGTSVEYTDVGYRILGLCLERIGNDNLDSLCKKLIWHPIGMNSTTYLPVNSEKINIAGHGKNWGTVDDSQDQLLNRPLGCDGVFSSAQDLTSFCRNFLKKIKKSNFYHTFETTISGQINLEWTFYESLGLGRKIFGWEAHTSVQSYLGHAHTRKAIEKAGGGGAFLCIRPEKNDFFIYLTNHGRPDPFTMDAWDKLVTTLRVREISKMVLP